MKINKKICCTFKIELHNQVKSMNDEFHAVMSIAAWCI